MKTTQHRCFRPPLVLSGLLLALCSLGALAQTPADRVELEVPESAKWPAIEVEREGPVLPPSGFEPPTPEPNPEALRWMSRRSFVYGRAAEDDRQFESATTSIEGIVGRADRFVRSLGFVGPGQSTGSGGDRAILCPEGMVVTGIYGRSGALIDQLGIVCGDRLGKTFRPDTVLGGSGGEPFEYECSPGARVRQFTATVRGPSPSDPDRAISSLWVSCTGRPVARLVFQDTDTSTAYQMLMPIARRDLSRGCGVPYDPQTLPSEVRGLLEGKTPRLIGIDDSRPRLFLQSKEALDPVDDSWSSALLDRPWNTIASMPAGGVGFTEGGFDGLCESLDDVTLCRDHWFLDYDSDTRDLRLVALEKTSNLDPAYQVVERPLGALQFRGPRLVGWLRNAATTEPPKRSLITDCSGSGSRTLWLAFHRPAREAIAFHAVEVTVTRRSEDRIGTQGQPVTLCTERLRLDSIALRDTTDRIVSRGIGPDWDQLRIVAGSTSRGYLLKYRNRDGSAEVWAIDDDLELERRLWGGTLPSNSTDLEMLISPDRRALDVFVYRDRDGRFETHRFLLDNEHRQTTDEFGNTIAHRKWCHSVFPEDRPFRSFRMFVARGDWSE